MCMRLHIYSGSFSIFLLRDRQLVIAILFVWESLRRKLAGGVAAAADEEQALAFCKAIYDREPAHGISYQTPSGFLTEYTVGQDLKFPRDVLRDKKDPIGVSYMLQSYSSKRERPFRGNWSSILPANCTALFRVRVRGTGWYSRFSSEERTRRVLYGKGRRKVGSDILI